MSKNNLENKESTQISSKANIAIKESTLKRIPVGFFSPQHIDHFAPNVEYSIINVRPKYNENNMLIIDIPWLQGNLEYVKSYSHRINLDLGPTISERANIETLQTQYIAEDGANAQKIFPPQKNNKISKLVSNKELERRLQGLPELLAEYRQNIGIILIVDEPYINGISPEEINRTTKHLKTIFSKANVQDLEYGAVFAGPLFNKPYANFINKKMMAYVEEIDNHYRNHSHLLAQESREANNFKAWVNIIQTSRLTTYDTANNIYLNGGIPKELDLVGFDFYLSTILFDKIHTDTLNYFHTIGIKECEKFNGKTTDTIKKELFYIQNDPADNNKATQASDKQLLDTVFNCRMQATTNLLKQELEKLPTPPKLMLIGESSANGAYRYESNGRVAQKQSASQLEQRILDEVQRSYRFYIANDIFTKGLYYFLFQDAFDTSINLAVGGASDYSSVLEFIYSIAQKPASKNDNNSHLNTFTEWKKEYRANK